MKSELKAKFLQHLVDKRKEEGFTLIELLVVIIIIGILSAIALPSFLNQANKARESEAKQYVGAANRAQQAFFLEQNTFTTDFQRLGLGLNTSTENYTYSIPTGDSVQALITAAPGNTNTLRAFMGAVSVGQSTTNETTTRSILCQRTVAGEVNTANISASPNTSVAPSCSGAFEEIS